MVVPSKYLGHLLPVGFGVQGGLSEQGGVLFWGYTQLIVKGVVPDLTGMETEQLMSKLKQLLPESTTAMKYTGKQP